MLLTFCQIPHINLNTLSIYCIPNMQPMKKIRTREMHLLFVNSNLFKSLLVWLNFVICMLVIWFGEFFFDKMLILFRNWLNVLTKKLFLVKGELHWKISTNLFLCSFIRDNLCTVCETIWCGWGSFTQFIEHHQFVMSPFCTTTSVFRRGIVNNNSLRL